MGFLDTVTMIVGIGIVGYASYAIIAPKLAQSTGIQLPQLQLPTLDNIIPTTLPFFAPPTEEPESIPEEPKTPTFIPTISEMTSPNVAGTSFTFNVVGDIDDNALAAATATNLCGTSPPTITMIIGDFAYHCDAQKWWTGSMRACNGKNVVGSVGNHDCGGKGFLELFPANGGKWTTIKKIGNIAFVGLNTGTCSAVCSNPSTEEPVIRQAQEDPSVKFIIVHFHKPIFTSGTAPDTPMSFHTMLKKYPKVKMAFAGHNHKYIRFVPIEGIQYITAGRGGHDATGKEPITKGASSNTVGVVKCRVDSSGGITCQYVANNGEILDNWGLTPDGRHTGSGGVTPKQGLKASESAYVQSYFVNRTDLLRHYYSDDKEDRDNAILDILFQQELLLHPRRKFNNKIFHYSVTTTRRR